MKIAIIASEGRSLKNFRGELIKEWVRLGHEVTAVSVEPLSEMKDMAAELGASYVSVSGDRAGTNIVNDLKMIRSYKVFLKKTRPDICFLYMSKPVAYGGIAARYCKVPAVYAMISGLEIAFYKNDLKNRMVRAILILFYKLSLKGADWVFFQNPDDRQRFYKLKITAKEQAVLVNGSGVDMTHFLKQPMPEGGDVILMVGRLVRYKGIYDFVGAAKLVKMTHPEVRFQVLGGIDTNSDAMTEEEVEELVQSGVIEYLGFVEDVRSVLKDCTIFVLPSRFEGVPRSALEAMATGRPVITANAPGCRETVIEGYNGRLVDCGDINGLASAITELIENPAMRNEMGEHSCQLCSEKFDVRKVNRKIIKNMGLS